MNISYKNNKLEQSLTIDRNIIKSYGGLSKKIKQRLEQLKAANDL
jgi:proteic killer suppression protein